MYFIVIYTYTRQVKVRCVFRMGVYSDDISLKQGLHR